MSLRSFTNGRFSTEEVVRVYLVLLIVFTYIFITFHNSEPKVLLKLRSPDFLRDANSTESKQSPVGKRKNEDYLTDWEITSGKGNLAPDDTRLLEHIQKNFLVLPPSVKNASSVDWNPAHPTVAPYKMEQQEVSRFVLDLFKGKKGGTFIEVGANDGEWYSNTQLLEQKYNWKGLLIESDPRPLKKLLVRKRNAWIAKCCLSTESQPKRIEFLRNDKYEGLSFIPGKLHFLGNEDDYYGFEAQCFPLYSILLAINRTAFDYFSVDIEGAELDVLRTVPWNKILIKVLSIEVHAQYVEPMKAFMTSPDVGYHYIKYIKNAFSHDQIYVHRSILDEINLP